jgi:hypothetical protein
MSDSAADDAKPLVVKVGDAAGDAAAEVGDAAAAAAEAAADAAGAAAEAAGDAAEAAGEAACEAAGNLADRLGIDWDASCKRVGAGLSDLKSVVLFPLVTGIMTGIGFVAGKRAAERYFYDSK